MSSNWGGIVSTALAGASGLVENLFGTSMEEEAAKKEAKLGEAPKFEVPTSQIAFEEGMRKRTRQDMPGMDAINQSIESSISTGRGAAARASGSQVGAMGGSNASLISRKKQLRQLGISNDQFKSQAQTEYGGAVKSRGQYEQNQFEYNKWLPWQIAQNEIASMVGYGQQKLMSGMDNASAAAIYGSSLLSNVDSRGTPTPQQTPIPYNYGAAGQSIPQMGMDQVAPASNLGTNPYR